ncbi:MAG TPA: hypothetical protein VFX17_00405 [Patescibacteria group bacterium]|nr:hypothetical protein [Patescibacteria group bacterium]
MNDPEQNSIKDKILKSIEAGKVQMRPRWHFVLRTILLVIGIVLAVLALLYLISFVIFALHQTGAWFVPRFGLGGLMEFLTSFPWLILLLALVFTVILEILVRKYSFGYQKPLLYTTLAIVVLVAAGGFAVSQTPFHRGLFDSARLHELPVAGGFYRLYGTPSSDNVAIGSIVRINNPGYTIQDRRDIMFEILVDDNTNFPDGNDFGIGDSIVVFGHRGDSNQIQALGIGKITEPEPPPLPQREILIPQNIQLK